MRELGARWRRCRSENWRTKRHTARCREVRTRSAGSNTPPATDIHTGAAARGEEGLPALPLHPHLSAASGRAGAKLNSSVFFCFSCPVATARAEASRCKTRAPRVYAPAVWDSGDLCQFELWTIHWRGIFLLMQHYFVCSDTHDFSTIFTIIDYISRIYYSNNETI
jgi:hypothetical protein